MVAVAPGNQVRDAHTAAPRLGSASCRQSTFLPLVTSFDVREHNVQKQTHGCLHFCTNCSKTFHPFPLLYPRPTPFIFQYRQPAEHLHLPAFHLYECHHAQLASLKLLILNQFVRLHKTRPLSTTDWLVVLLGLLESESHWLRVRGLSKPRSDPLILYMFKCFCTRYTSCFSPLANCRTLEIQHSAGILCKSQRGETLFCLHVIQ